MFVHVCACGQPSLVNRFTLVRRWRSRNCPQLKFLKSTRFVCVFLCQTSASSLCIHCCCYFWNTLEEFSRPFNTFNARAKIMLLPEVVGLVVIVLVLVAAVAVILVGWWHLAWCRAKALSLVNQVVVHRARLAVGWVTICSSSSSSSPLYQYY